MLPSSFSSASTYPSGTPQAIEMPEATDLSVSSTDASEPHHVDVAPSPLPVLWAYVVDGPPIPGIPIVRATAVPVDPSYDLEAGLQTVAEIEDQEPQRVVIPIDAEKDRYIRKTIRDMIVLEYGLSTF